MLGALTAALALVAGAAPLALEDRYPTAAASYLVVVDGQPLWGREIGTPRAPASLTKIMTALLVLEDGGPLDAWVTVSARAAAATGSRAGLRAGEVLRRGDLLTALLVRSANDACLALAEHAAGSAAAFVARMNERARALALGATHFENPCGHDAPEHRASAEDLWRLARAALEQPEICSRALLPRARLVTRAGRAIDCRAQNALVGRLEGAVGLKSGYTPGAGRCLVAVVRREGHEVLLVLLDARDRWWTAAALVEAALEAADGGAAAHG